MRPRPAVVAIAGMAAAALAAMVAGPTLARPLLTGAGGLLAGAVVVLVLSHRHPEIAWPLRVAFALRAGAAVLGVLVAPLPDSGADAATFEREAARIAEGGFTSVWSTFALGSGLYPFLLSIPYSLLGRSVLFAASINVLLGALVILNVHMTARDVWNDRVGRRAAWIAALWPALVLYSAITLREAFFVYLLTLGAASFARWFRSGNPLLLAAAAAGLGFAGWFHRGAVPPIALVAGAGALAALAALVRRRPRVAVSRAGGAALACVVGVVLVAPLAGIDLEDVFSRAHQADAPADATEPPTPALASEAPAPTTPARSDAPTPPPPPPTPTPAAGSHPPAPTTPPRSNATTPLPPAPPGTVPVLGAHDFSPDLLAARQQAGAGARSAYLTGLPQRSIFDAAWQAPLRSAYFLFSPMPWDVELLKDIVGLFDGLLYLTVAILLWRGRRELRANPAALALVAIAALLVVVYAANTFNAGTALRHRAKIAPILIALVPMVPWPTLRHNGTHTRVLHVVNAPESFLQNRLPLALAARQAGYQVEVAGPMGSAVERIRDLGFSYHVVALDRRGTNPLAEVRTFFALLKVYRQSRPDIVHHFTVKPVVYGGIAARLARVPACIHTITGLGYVFTSRDAKARALRPLVSLAYTFSFDHPRCRVVLQNEEDRALLESAGVSLRGSTTLVRGSGVDLAAYRPQPEPHGAPLVVLPSRMLRDKGVGEFVEAARSLRATGARFALVGDTDDGNPAAIPREQLEAWAKEGVVEWWGWRADMPAVYAKASVVCLPSYREGVPKALLEAAACGRAIVATDVPGCRDVVVHRESGLLVPAHDAKALAAALDRVVRDPSLRARMGAAGRRLVAERFGADRIAREYLGVYEGATA